MSVRLKLGTSRIGSNNTWLEKIRPNFRPVSNDSELDLQIDLQVRTLYINLTILLKVGWRKLLDHGGSDYAQELLLD